MIESDYKFTENSQNTVDLLLLDREEKIEKSSLKEIKEDNSTSVSNKIQLICELWQANSINQVFEEFSRFLELFRNIKDNYIPESITNMINLIFDIVIPFFSETQLEVTDIMLMVINKCLFNLVNISAHSILIPTFPPTIYDLLCSHFCQHKTEPAIPDKNNIFILCPESIKILVNLSSDENICQEIKKKLSLDDIRYFYVNQYEILTANSIEDILIKQQKGCLKIFYNILRNSDLENADFPGEQVLNFVQEMIDLSKDTKQIKWIINIIFLLVQNESAAHQIMADSKLIMFVNLCLHHENMNTIFRKSEEIIKIQITSLKIFSMLLNIKNYLCVIDIKQVVDLSNDQNSFELVLAALQTLHNFADSNEHTDILIENDVLPIIHERINFGNYKMKQAAIKVLVNMFYFPPNKHIMALVKYEIQYDVICFYKTLSEIMSETDIPKIIHIGLVGLLNFFTRLAELDVDLIEILNISGLVDILPELSQIDDENVESAQKALMSFISEKMKPE